MTTAIYSIGQEIFPWPIQDQVMGKFQRHVFVEDEKKACSKCGQIKPTTQFYKAKDRASGFKSQCIECGRADNLERQKTEAVKAQRALWWQNNRDRAKTYRDNTDAEKKREYGRRYARKHRRKVVLARHGMTEEDYENLLSKQNGLCAICTTEPNEPLFIDHCHETGVVRGLLCRTCNAGIGCLRDDITILKAAIVYLAHKD